MGPDGDLRKVGRKAGTAAGPEGTSALRPRYRKFPGRLTSRTASPNRLTERLRAGVEKARWQ